MARKLGADTTFPAAVTAVQHAPGVNPVSQPLLAVRQRLNPANTRVYASFLEDLGGCAAGSAASPLSAFALRSADLGVTWAEHQVAPPSPTTACDYRGRGPAAALLDTGEVLAVLADVDVRAAGAPTPSWVNNNGLPIVTRSDDEGATWEDAALVGASANPTINPPLPGDVIGVDGEQFLPYVAVRKIPNGDDEVYVFFAGRDSSGDTDLYIARSINDGQTFPAVYDLHLLHLTDADLHGIDALPTGPDQIPAGIAVGDCGDIHILWYDAFDQNPLTPEEDLNVFWAEIEGFGTATQTVTVARLTPTAFQVGTAQSPVFLGERQGLVMKNMGFGGLHSYAAYTATDGGLRNVYFQRIIAPASVCGIEPGPGDQPSTATNPDIDGDGYVTAADAAAFNSAYVVGQEEADADLNGAVAPGDLPVYYDAYDALTGGQ